MEVAGTRYVAEVAHHLPALAENLGFFALEELGVPVNPGRQAVAFFLRLGAGGSGRVNRPKRVAAFMGAFSSVDRRGLRSSSGAPGPAAPAVIGRSYNNGLKAVKPDRTAWAAGPCRPFRHRSGNSRVGRPFG